MSPPYKELIYMQANAIIPAINAEVVIATTISKMM
tara:strand:- start:1070 stop:1174 length:105 start_codon:yes stop_codon:yes gene_type:complete